MEMSNDGLLFARTPSNAVALRQALAQSRYFRTGKQGEATDEEVFAYAEGMWRGFVKAAPKFRAAADAMARAWGEAAQSLIRLNRAIGT